MSGPSQFVQVPGPVKYKRQYTLWILILLVIVCWPAAIIYYFTRDKVPVQEFQAYQAPAGMPAYGAPPPQAPAAGAGGRFCPACGAPGQTAGGFCARCGKQIPP